jgi:hypothetical protein
MTDVDANKTHLINQAIGWLENAKKYHAVWQHQVADDCLVKAKAVLNDPAFSRQVIPGYSRSQQPETLWVKNPVTNGKMLINGSDFDPNVHQIWEEPTPPATTKRSKSS